MAKKEKNDGPNGCFAWLIRIKQSVNERWAKARNSLRKKLARDNTTVNPITADDLLNESGSPDMIITKVPASSRLSSPHGDRKKDANSKDRPSGPKLDSISDNDIVSQNKTTYITCNAEGDPDIGQVRIFVESIIDEAIGELEAEVLAERQIENDVPIIKETTSLTSSVISDMATAVVNKSLTHIIHDMDHETRPIIGDTFSTPVVVVNDASSISSGALSDMATAVVNKSLTHIIHDMEHETRPIIDDTFSTPVVVVNDASSISSGALSDLATAVVNTSMTNIIQDIENESKTVIDDTSSLSSGALSGLADAIVSHSLSRIISETENTNQSARRPRLRNPKTVTEMLEQLQMDPQIGLISHGENGLPPCSP